MPKLRLSLNSYMNLLGNGCSLLCPRARKKPGWENQMNDKDNTILVVDDNKTNIKVLIGTL